MSTFLDLIGRKKSDAGVAAFVDSLGICTATDSFGGFYISDYPPAGACVYFSEEEELVTVFLYAEGHEDHSQFRGELPHEASFADRRSDVLRRLGTVERSGPDWDLFTFPSHSVHFQYSSEGSLQLITVMAPPKKEEPNQPLQRNASTGAVSNFQSPARRG